MQSSAAQLDVAVPLLAEREVSFYSDHQTIPVPARAPMAALGVQAPDNIHIRAIRVTLDNGDEATVTTKTTGRVDIPGPARTLREVKLLYANDAPPDTYARIRLYDLSVPEELSPPTITARR
jgi:hypothetical protein